MPLWFCKKFSFSLWFLCTSLCGLGIWLYWTTVHLVVGLPSVYDWDMLYSCLKSAKISTFCDISTEHIDKTLEAIQIVRHASRMNLIFRIDQKLGFLRRSGVFWWVMSKNIKMLLSCLVYVWCYFLHIGGGGGGSFLFCMSFVKHFYGKLKSKCFQGVLVHFK